MVVIPFWEWQRRAIGKVARPPSIGSDERRGVEREQFTKIVEEVMDSLPEGSVSVSAMLLLW